MIRRPWLKVTFLRNMPGVSRVSNYPRVGWHEQPGRWVVFDMTLHPNPTPAQIISDHDSADEAGAECQRLRMGRAA